MSTAELCRQLRAWWRAQERYHTSTPQDRRRLRAWWRAQNRDAVAWPTTKLGRMGVPVPWFRGFPLELYYLTCGARTRQGTPCKNPALRGYAGPPPNRPRRPPRR